VSDRYRPSRLAHACAPASIARQSLPVAIATASIPFMTPLLCVAARQGSAHANRVARAIAWATASPDPPSMASNSVGIVQRARASRRDARFERIRIATGARASVSISGASRSHTVFTMFAPMASRQSRWTSTTTNVSACSPGSS
jgi:hypothetical protein